MRRRLSAQIFFHDLDRLFRLTHVREVARRFHDPQRAAGKVLVRILAHRRGTEIAERWSYRAVKNV